MFHRRPSEGIPAGITAHAQPVIPNVLDGTTLSFWTRAEWSTDDATKRYANDRSGLGNTFSRALATAPGFDTINGKTAFNFNGSTHVLDGPALNTIALSTAFTWFLVVEADANGASGIACLLGATGRWAGATYGTTVARVFNYDGAEDNAQAVLALATPAVVMVRHASGSIGVSVNGGTEVTAASGNTTQLTDALLMGGSGTGFTAFDGSIGEVVACKAALTAQQIAAIVAYLKTTWAIV